MIYDYMELVPEMKVSFNLIADSFSVEIVHHDEEIILDAGNFSLNYDKTNKKT